LEPHFDAITYYWTAPEGITLSSNTSSKPTFMLPEEPAGNVYAFTLVVNDGRENSVADQVVINLIDSDKWPYVQDPIDDISVEKRSPEQIIDLTTVFADDDTGDILSYSVTGNTNDKVVQATISGTNLILKFSTENVGFSDITITAESNGKIAESAFNVEVRIPTLINPENEISAIKIFPNPTRGPVQINFNKIPEANSWISIFDVSGKLISKIKAEDKEQSINLQGNVPGIYLVKINEKNSKTYRIVLE